MDHDLAALAARLQALPPSCGPVRLVAVDGHAGSGKSTFATRLAAACADQGATHAPAPVLRLDDLATHEELFAWTGRLREQVLEPLTAGRSARYGVYDWVRRRFESERALAPAPVVLLEGVGAGRRAVRPYLAELIWMETAEETAWARGRRRDGPGLAAFWDGWIPSERKHFAMDPSRPYANLLVSEGQKGYEWCVGPVDAR